MLVQLKYRVCYMSEINRLKRIEPIDIVIFINLSV
jgi:hypothetical protein